MSKFKGIVKLTDDQFNILKNTGSLTTTDGTTNTTITYDSQNTLYLTPNLPENLVLNDKSNTLTGNQEIVGDLILTGNLNITGSVNEIQTQIVQSENDFIELRYGNSSALASNTKSGLKFINYDGSTNGILAIDNTGTVYVGDEGDERPLTTRANLTASDDEKIIIWDDATKSITTSPNTVPSILSQFNNYLPLSAGPNKKLTGALNFSEEAKIQSDAKIFRFGDSSDGNSVAVLAGTGSTYFFRAGINNKSDLGTSAVKWKNLYLSGNLTDGTNSISVADIANKSNIPTNYVTTDTVQKIEGAKHFSGTVGNTQTEAGIYLGLDQNTGAENANIAIVSANTASYIDMGRPDIDYDFRIIKWNQEGNTHAQLVYGGNASGTITIPQATGTMALTSDIPTNYVTTNTDQQIESRKRFNEKIFVYGGMKAVEPELRGVNISGVKKYIANGAQLGIWNMSVNSNGDLIFSYSDGSELTGGAAGPNIYA